MRKSSQPARIRRYLPVLDRRAHATLERALRPAIARWHAEGWAFVGVPPRMRIAVLVARKLAAPVAPATTIELPASLGSGRLKVAVLALHRDARPETATAGAMPTGAGTDYLAPGVPIGCDNERVGLAAVLALDRKPHLITCGHAIGSADSTLTTGDGATEIGRLHRNLFSSGDNLDAAVFTPTSDGLALLQAGASAPTWCASIHEPVAGDNGKAATFWPTWADSQSPFVEDVMAFSSSIPGGVGVGYVMLPCCTARGDSGSLLQIDNSYYGLASRRDGNYSFFTPISRIKRKLEDSGAKVTPWRPS